MKKLLLLAIVAMLSGCLGYPEAKMYVLNHGDTVVSVTRIHEFEFRAVVKDSIGNSKDMEISKAMFEYYDMKLKANGK